MKYLITLSILVFGFYQVNAQKMEEAAVPQTVKASFAKAYPTVKKVKWEKEDDNFEAEFKLNSIETSVVFNNTGEVLETETEISLKELPEAVLNKVKESYSVKDIEEIAKIETKKGIQYEVEIELKEKTIELIYDSTGKLLKKEEKNEKEDEDE